MYYCRRLHNLKRPKKYEQTMYYCRRLHILSGKYVEIPWRYTSNKQKCKAKVRTDFTHSERVSSFSRFAHCPANPRRNQKNFKVMFPVNVYLGSRY